MGFGYLLIGYLITFVLYLPANALGFGFVALLAGYGLMLYGLMSLRRYHPAFSAAAWMQIPLLLTALYDAAVTVCAFFSLDPWFLRSSAVKSGMDWATFLLLILFHLALLYAVRALTESIELKKLSVSATRNALLIFIYAVLYIIGQFPLPEAVMPYLTLLLNLCNLLWIVLDLWLLLSCTKNICPAGEEELPPKKSRFAWVNRLEETYERNHQALSEQARREGEALARRNRERMEKKNRKKRGK